MHYIIIGAGPAGIVAAETLRENDPDGEITVINAEKEPPYSRMAIPYFLEENITEEGSYLRDHESHFEKHKIGILQDSVSDLDASAQKISLASGNTLNFDKLLIATGSNALTPPIPGIDLDCVSSCWTLEDARNIVGLAAKGSNVVLIGAGFIGCIILQSLVKRGVNLTVVETGDRMVPRMLNDKAGGLLKQWCLDKGINVQTSCSVESINQGGNGAKVKLSNGLELPADLVITATGVKPNTEFMADSGIKIKQGIIVNEFLQTSNENIYAAGDVAQGLDFSTGLFTVQAIQPTATDHGRIAALNMCGKTTSFHGSVNMNILDTLGLISCSFGLWMGVEGESADSSEIYNADNFNYINLQFDDDILVGASCIGFTQHIGAIRGLIESKIPLGPWKERLKKDPTQIMQAYIGSTQTL
jgi:NAD(P)H-nitrite reductase large subunit